MINDSDLKYLERSLELARKALDKGDQPFGSLLVSAEGDILYEDHNHVASGDHTQHPEFNIARWAGQNLLEEEKSEATVYTSGEHCPMCAAAHGLAGLGRIVYASSSEQLSQWKKELGVEEKSKVRELSLPEVLRDPQVAGPVPELARQVRELHERYYEKQERLS